jgi:hypothetical protein
MKNRTTGTGASKPVSVIARENLAHLIAPHGMPSLLANLGRWEPGASYVIAGRSDTGADAMVLTFAERFATHGGHIIWIGITDDLGRLSERLMFKIAGLDLATAGTRVQLDAISQIKLAFSHEQIGKLWIDFCNVEDCGDTEVEQEFLASMSSFKPTLIVVDESIFDEATLNPFEVMVRQTHALRMIDELRGTNPMSSVLWHLPMSHTIDMNTKQRPSINDLPDAASSIKPDVVLFTHRNDGSELKHNAELIVAANAYGPTGTVPMILDAKRSTWREIDIAA